VHDLLDAAPGLSWHDGRMNEEPQTAAGWVDEVQHLLIHGRDREAAELAARNAQGDLVTTTASGGDHAMGPVQQLEELGPLLGQVASRLTPSDLDAPTPCSDFTVRGVLGHMIGGATQFAAAFRGTTPAVVPVDVADRPDVVERAGAALGDLIAAISAPGALDQMVAAPFGEMPGEAFARFVVLDGLVHGWDIATATGQAYDPSDQLVAEVEGFARQAIADEMRDGDTFAAEVTAPADASPIERLAAFTGRAVR
jgi:uncharacterized protein (TIGR03086 family)